MAKAVKPDEDVTAQALAERCGETYDTINHWARMRLLPYKKRGRSRLFSAAESERRCRKIRELQNDDCNLAAIRRIISDGT